MSDRPATGVDVATPEHRGLEPDAIGVTEDTFGVVVVGFVLMFLARFGLRSPFFGIRRESAEASYAVRLAASRRGRAARTERVHSRPATM